MRPRPPVWTTGVLALTVAAFAAAPAAAGGQRHAPAGSGGAPTAAAVPRAAPAPAPAPAPSPSPRASAGRDASSDRGQDRGSARNDNGDSSSDAGRGSSATGRRRGNLPATGDAVARKSPPRPPHEGGGGGTIVGYPWWYGGGYFGGYYAYDPWFGSYPPDDPAPPAPSVDADGALKLKVKPSEASVYVDGYYVGIVDEFDGLFQRLELAPGPHHIEIIAPEYETLSFDVMIQPAQTMTYRGELKKQER